MFSPRSQAGECGADGKKFDPMTGQWMREAMESRVAIEELKAQNDKLQREVYGLNSKMNLMYECCAELGVVDRLGDLMQRKLREFQAAQGFICGSSTFQDVAAYSSSYKGQVSRGNFHRVRMFEAEEAKLRDQLDIFGVPKLPLQKAGSYSPTASNRRSGDTIDKLLMSADAPMKSSRQDTQRLYGSAPVGYTPSEGGLAASTRAQGRLVLLYDPYLEVLLR
ncbi:hypothetical protein PHYSODRAFT_468175 [Phytophthora sojae]|uniref:Uncharacterized protein n=1 Tax=Phytophthora sojae (strain P6497) TaxID=1094619 RepID=G4YNC4_PHYSP|nr:hypothetical protein PHYSODRAFT_468175 [Phytophthora sojae]EGZ30217.1 hypothetical protein PHYSODRAFT_468175 [Phytophthora sojae]|eukprot:XP_009517492.1 hypothetical protein PHYSODRAFT_468175 [Phytophthora sojae]